MRWTWTHSDLFRWRLPGCVSQYWFISGKQKQHFWVEIFLNFLWATAKTFLSLIHARSNLLTAVISLIRGIFAVIFCVADETLWDADPVWTAKLHRTTRHVGCKSPRDLSTDLQFTCNWSFIRDTHVRDHTYINTQSSVYIGFKDNSTKMLKNPTNIKGSFYENSLNGSTFNREKKYFWKILRQFLSSEKSPQSLSPSQCHLL